MRMLTKLFAALLALAALAYVAAAAYLYAVQDSMVLPQTVTTYPAPPDPALTPYEKLAIPTPDGATLSGILLNPSPSATTLVIAFGGNAHDVIGMATFLKQAVFPSPSVVVAGVTYRGYPNVLNAPSTGKPSQQALYADSERIYDTLHGYLNPTRTYAVGYSLGTSVAAHLATARPLSGLALVAPPASIRRIARARYPWLPVNLLLKNPFPTEDFIGTITVPTTIIYTPTDGLIPPSHVAVLHAAAPRAHIVKVEGTDHGHILNHPALPAILRAAFALSATTPR